MAAPDASATRRVVIVHDFMETFGGAERITAELARAFPQAPVVAILGRAEVAARAGVEDRFVSLLPARDRVLRHYRLLAPGYPVLAAVRRLPPADVVIASSYAFAHGFAAVNGAPRICYSWGPARFAWSMEESYRRHWAGSPAARLAFSTLAAWIRWNDRRAASGVARFLAPLPEVAERIRIAYGAEAEIVPPPVDCELFAPAGDHAPRGDAGQGDYYLFCGRLVEPYKRVTMLVEAFAGLDDRLVIAGDGPARAQLEAIAGPNVSFVGQLDDRRLVELMRGCRAAIFPSRDDFGLVPVEVMACGRPVLAFAGGGAVETIVPGVTGELFDEQESGAIAAAVRGFEPDRFDPRAIRRHALRWDAGRFRERITEIVEALAPDHHAT